MTSQVIEGVLPLQTPSPASPATRQYRLRSHSKPPFHGLVGRTVRGCCVANERLEVLALKRITGQRMSGPLQGQSLLDGHPRGQTGADNAPRGSDDDREGRDVILDQRLAGDD